MKTELIEGTEDVKNTDIGYTDDVDTANSINELFDSTFGRFLAENRTKLELGIVKLSNFFDAISSVEDANKVTENYELVKHLPKIIDLKK
tara:strand:- start:16619 stop:16888 length:270 start_codon:yes stop_codon:yes gene_type:complete